MNPSGRIQNPRTQARGVFDSVLGSLLGGFSAPARRSWKVTMQTATFSDNGMNCPPHELRDLCFHVEPNSASGKAGNTGAGLRKNWPSKDVSCVDQVLQVARAVQEARQKLPELKEEKEVELFVDLVSF